MYTITLPGKLYQSLADMEIFSEDDVPPEAREAFLSAVPGTYGRGRRYHITGPSKKLYAVLDVLASLADEVADRKLPGYHFGVEPKVLRTASKQPLLRWIK